MEKKLYHYVDTPNKNFSYLYFQKEYFSLINNTGQIRPFKEDGTVINQIALYGRKGINLYQDETESVLLLSSKIHRYYLNTGRIQQLSDNQTSIEGQAIPIGFDSQKTYLYDLKHIYAIDHQTNKNRSNLYFYTKKLHRMRFKRRTRHFLDRICR